MSVPIPQTEVDYRGRQIDSCSMLSLDLVPIFKDGVTVVVYLGC